MTRHLISDESTVDMESEVHRNTSATAAIATWDTDPRPRTGVSDLSDCPQSTRSMSLSSSASSVSPTFSARAHSSPAPRPRPRRASQGSVSVHHRLHSPLSRLLSKDKAGLQLSCFNSLGISCQIIPTSATSSRLAADPMPLDTPSCDHSQSDHPPSGPLTPPADEEDGHVNWRSAQGEPVTSRDPKPPVLMDQSRTRNNTSPSNPHEKQHTTFDQMSHRPSLDEDERMSGQEMNDEVPSQSWLENAIDAILSALLLDSNNRVDSMRLVSQTLPFPQSPENNVQLPTQGTVFGAIIETLRDRRRPENPPYIHVIHAVPEDFSLSNLPTSPPSTPGHMMQLDNYFDETVFASASTVPLYHDIRGFVRKVNWPHPIVPPYSTHISVLERYIPPSTTHEYRDLFSPGRPSVLTDRLLELSPLGGCLLFIYPTKKGAITFKSQYLGPILDPLLRQLVVVNGFSADVSRDLGRLEAVNGMDDFQTMRANVELLCQRMSNHASTFSLVSAGKGLAPLDRNLWMEWYIQQERPRMKDLLSRNWQAPGRHPPNSPETGGNQLSSSMLLGEIMEGIKRRRYDVSPKEDIELGVFVIRRSHQR